MMTRQVGSVRAEERTSTAARMMWDCDCGVVPVLGEGDRVIAVVTDRDICMASLFQDAPPSAIPIASAMSKELRFCSPEDSVTSAEQTMRAHQIRRLPVLDDERRLLGMLSLADIIRATERDEARRREVPREELTATLADICERRQPATSSVGA